MCVGSDSYLKLADQIEVLLWLKLQWLENYFYYDFKAHRWLGLHKPFTLQTHDTMVVNGKRTNLQW